MRYAAVKLIAPAQVKRVGLFFSVKCNHPVNIILLYFKYCAYLKAELHFFVTDF